MWIGYMVDAQNDFMKKEGKLYVKGAEKLFPNIRRINELLTRRGVPIWASADAHTLKTKELARNGGPWPDHCIKGTKGQEICEETGYKPDLFVNENIPLPNNMEVNLVFEKDEYDVFSVENYDCAFEKVTGTVVYGVALDYCVKDAVLGLRKRGIQVYFVRDATARIAPETAENALREIRAAGVSEILTTGLAQTLERILRNE